MSDEPAIVMESVSKKFRRGETHDSLRDWLPGLLGRWRKHDPTTRPDEFWALRDVDFAIEAGSACGIIGPNGAGKSTILKMLSGIMRPDRGRCGVRGRLSSLIEVGAGFHMDLTGRENIFLNGAILGMGRKELKRRFDDIVDFAELGAFIDTPIKRYSSGMQARLGFSVAAHMDPDVLLVDEVLSVGDMSFQNRCLQKMMDFQKRGTTIVFVSHNLQAVSRMCRRLILLDRGRVVRDGATAEVIGTYLTLNTVRSDERGRVNRRAWVHDVALRTADGGPPQGVRPGTPMHLRCRVRINEACDNVTFGFVLTRLVDNLYVYGANVSELGVEPGAFGAGEEITLDFSFCAHLTRGLYAVSIHVKDLNDQSYLEYAHACATIDVTEQVSWDGVADVALQCAVTEAPIRARAVVA